MPGRGVGAGSGAVRGRAQRQGAVSRRGVTYGLRVHLGCLSAARSSPPLRRVSLTANTRSGCGSAPLPRPRPPDPPGSPRYLRAGGAARPRWQRRARPLRRHDPEPPRALPGRGACAECGGRGQQGESERRAGKQREESEGRARGERGERGHWAQNTVGTPRCGDSGHIDRCSGAGPRDASVVTLPKGRSHVTAR